MKKVRLLYWKLKDAGRKNQVIVFGILSCIAAISLFTFLLSGVIRNTNQKRDAVSETGSNRMPSESIGTEKVMDTETERESMEQMSVFGFIAGTEKKEIDLSVFDVFSAYMPEKSLQQLKEQMADICKKRKVSVTKKLVYQRTNEVTYDISSYILLSDGCVYQCNYNLKSNVLSVVETNLTEEQVEAMNQAEQKAEAETLQKQQEAEKIKAANNQNDFSGKKTKVKKKKTSGKKSKKEKKTGKKVSGKKPMGKK